MLSFSNPIFILLASTGVSIWIICIYVLRNPPKERNRTYGYRTPRAMNSQEAWDYAQQKGTQRMLFASQVLCLLSVPGLFISFNELLDTVIAITLVISALIIPLWQTEKELKDKFG